ncbi:GRP family sugar transporter [Culicoidibacter larvae]|uniref:Glucose transporter GlcU n=1 Tax=Culicoidibacter larvae TaxID=2579976 RepID=A0A5R8Q9Y3_9FIRM|nr:GRP family sugar transporter [Culicoidibacter larvae]TLG72710.1 glucose transporter GlcU [Culicoidibacter larvae]
MAIMIALLPALLWGIIPLLITKIGGSIRQQIIGITSGALIFAGITFFFTSPVYTLQIILISFLTGFMWTVGQIYQLKAFKLIGVSRAMPLSTGMQLIGTALVGVVAFGEWNTPFRLITGAIAILLIIGGVFLTAFTEASQSETSGLMRRGLMMLALSSLGYILYVVTLQAFAIDGISAILPQAIGMVVSAFLMTMRNTEENTEAIFTKRTLLLTLPGISWASGNIAMIYANSLVGVATGFSLSQLGVIISTLGAVFLFKEEKTKKELLFVIAGVLLVAIGGVVIGLTK